MKAVYGVTAVVHRCCTWHALISDRVTKLTVQLLCWIAWSINVLLEKAHHALI